jgi:hypothetical protein
MVPSGLLLEIAGSGSLNLGLDGEVIVPGSYPVEIAALLCMTAQPVHD